jgi:hypothetical protein
VSSCRTNRITEKALNDKSTFFSLCGPCSRPILDLQECEQGFSSSQATWSCSSAELVLELLGTWFGLKVHRSPASLKGSPRQQADQNLGATNHSGWQPGRGPTISDGHATHMLDTWMAGVMDQVTRAIESKKRKKGGFYIED